MQAVAAGTRTCSWTDSKRADVRTPITHALLRSDAGRQGAPQQRLGRRVDGAEVANAVAKDHVQHHEPPGASSGGGGGVRGHGGI